MSMSGITTVTATTATRRGWLSLLLSSSKQQQQHQPRCISSSHNWNHPHPPHRHHSLLRHYRRPQLQQQPSVSSATAAADVRRFFHASSLANQKLSNNDEADDNDHLPKTTKRLEDANPERIHGIHVNPDSLGYHILPGNLIYKTYRWTGNVRKIPVELARGYFWMVRDLRATDSKPTLSNRTIIPEQDAQTFPETLSGVQLLSVSDNASVDLPWYFLHDEDDDDDTDKAKPKLTLLAISFRDNGYKMIPSWTRPLQNSENNDILQTYNLSITEHWVLYPFQSLLQRVMRQNTPPAEHATTLVKFGNSKQELDDFRDILRMHNIMTAYVFLLDDLGRVRFAGSGPATDQDIKHLQYCIDQWMDEIQSYSNSSSCNKKKNNKK